MKTKELAVKLPAGKDVTFETFEVTIKFPDGEEIKAFSTKEKNAKKPSTIHVEANRRQLRCYGEQDKEELLVGNVAKFRNKYGNLNS